ncbi:MAG: hypothetical protein HXY22_04955 [Alphaproteobacteria bacterium]|nr:hypothetical protein [Alphaproteobacteria bacterium]
MSDSITTPASSPEAAPNLKFLKTLVIVLGVLIILALGVLFTAIVWRSFDKPAPKPETGEVISSIALPEGARIEDVILDGDRVALRVSGPGTEEIIIVDIVEGRIIGRVRVNTAQ